MGGHRGQPAADPLPGMRRTVQFAPQHLLTNASGSVRSRTVIVRARLGRWRCRNLKCDRRIFAERLPGLAASLSRQATRLAEIVRLLGHSAGGRPSERLMRRLGMPVSDMTILTSLKHRAKLRRKIASESSSV